MQDSARDGDVLDKQTLKVKSVNASAVMAFCDLLVSWFLFPSDGLVPRAQDRCPAVTVQGLSGLFHEFHDLDRHCDDHRVRRRRPRAVDRLQGTELHCAGTRTSPQPPPPGSPPPGDPAFRLGDGGTLLPLGGRWRDMIFFSSSGMSICCNRIPVTSRPHSRACLPTTSWTILPIRSRSATVHPASRPRLRREARLTPVA